MTSQSTTPTDTVNISDSVAKLVTLHRALTNTVQISNTFVGMAVARPHDTDDIHNTVGVTGNFVQYDTWRPVAKPTDNSLILVCRSPENYHDSPAGLEHMALWTVHPDGSDEHPVLLDCTHNGHGWLRMSHQEWSPNGKWIVLAVETSNSYKLVLVNSSAYGL